MNYFDSATGGMDLEAVNTFRHEPTDEKSHHDDDDDR